MSIFATTDHADLNKTRRSLYVCGVFTLVVANATFLTNKISLFGLEFAIEQSDLVALGQLVTIFLLLIFVLQTAEAAVEACYKILRAINERSEDKSNKTIEAISNDIERRSSGQPEQGPEDYLEPWEFDAYQASLMRERNESMMMGLKMVVSGFVAFTTKYTIVLSVSVFAVFFPEQLSALIQFWQTRN